MSLIGLSKIMREGFAKSDIGDRILREKRHMTRRWKEEGVKRWEEVFSGWSATYVWVLGFGGNVIRERRGRERKRIGEGGGGGGKCFWEYWFHLVCVIRLLLWLKAFPQTMHLCGFSPEKIFQWLPQPYPQFLFLRKNVGIYKTSQSVHTNIFRWGTHKPLLTPPGGANKQSLPGFHIF